MPNPRNGPTAAALLTRSPRYEITRAAVPQTPSLRSGPTPFGIVKGMPTLDLNAKSPDGKTVIGFLPYVKPDGNPAVVMIVKTTADGVFESTLDGQPAVALMLGEDSSGNNNAPWQIGELLVQNWEKAKKLARKK